ncbi:hypothetical protein O9G_001098 [Rozella allomycis CSF55]|uniref:PIG-F-domain-containing protein n=1 Tax=Rozella allomycis (strain CSF55) TaxID=988480 RepID=A0A075AN47_ROZAC|nr:hypothetical protein O9G_001098 [Rozella allomycis CSF55]|eukprot:EPZ31186.1 hypothetical protein O9G_001098 [Rozella allomycis CSF55]
MSQRTYSLIDTISIWPREFNILKTENDYRIYGAILGAWSSAIVVPLDWERDWQVWPIPALIGASMGHTIGTLIFTCATKWKWKSVKTSKSE